MMTKELRTKIAYTIAWLLYTLGVKSIAKLPEIKNYTQRLWRLGGVIKKTESSVNSPSISYTTTT